LSSSPSTSPSGVDSSPITRRSSCSAGRTWAIACKVYCQGMLALPPPPCAPAQLRPALLGSNGAAGTILLSVVLRNAGGTCTLRGYPGLRLIGPMGPLPTRVEHGGLAVLRRPVRTIRLTHGQRATVLIAYNDVPVGSERRCPTG